MTQWWTTYRTAYPYLTVTLVQQKVLIANDDK
jgi:hypothetical protein